LNVEPDHIAAFGIGLRLVVIVEWADEKEPAGVRVNADANRIKPGWIFDRSFIDRKQRAGAAPGRVLAAGFVLSLVRPPNLEAMLGAASQKNKHSPSPFLGPL